MTSKPQTQLTVEEAKKILSRYDFVDVAPQLKPSQKISVRRALTLLAKLCDYQILGISADTTEEGIKAMESYSTALGYEPPSNLPSIEGPVYIKLNGKNGLCYIDSYLGHHRGVLVSCQSCSEGGMNHMYGHLPLDLFD